MGIEYRTCSMGAKHEIVVCDKCHNEYSMDQTMTMTPPLGSLSASHPARICMICADDINKLFNMPPTLAELYGMKMKEG